jgi:hypothetical protein
MSYFKYTVEVIETQEFTVYKDDMPEDLRNIQNDFDKLLEEINLRGFNSLFQNQIDSNPHFWRI